MVFPEGQGREPVRVQASAPGRWSLEFFAETQGVDGFRFIGRDQRCVLAQQFQAPPETRILG